MTRKGTTRVENSLSERFIAKKAGYPSEPIGNWRQSQASREEASVDVIDLFSGCGGMSLGFAATKGFRLVGAGDINESSLETYTHNLGAPALRQDVVELAYKRGALKKFLSSLPEYDSNRPLVLIGCAPCQGFSAHRKKNWDVKDDRNNLVVAFAEVAAKLRPRVVVMENVPELLSGRYWSYFEAFRQRLEGLGYKVGQGIHNTAEFGVPQERFRALVIASQVAEIDLPTGSRCHTEFRTVRDAIGNLPKVLHGETDSRDAMHKSATHRSSTLDVIRQVSKDGGSRPPGVGPACLQRVKGFYDVYGRLAWDRPSITITHYARNPASGRFVHPVQDRGLTMREAARLQSFPDSFEFKGTFDDTFRQIGEAVPPMFAEAVAQAVLNGILGKSHARRSEAQVFTPVKDSYSGVISGIKSQRA